MMRMRRIAVLTATISAALPGVAHGAVTCPTQTALPAWAGSPKALTLNPGCTSNVGPVTYAITVNPAHGTATVPDAAGKFTFTGAFNNSGPDYVGADQFSVTASDGVDTQPATVLITIGAAPILDGSIDAASLTNRKPLTDGTPAFGVLYRDPVTVITRLLDGTNPLAGFVVRMQGLPGAPVQKTTPANGTVTVVYKPVVSDLFQTDVPSLPGTFAAAAAIFVGPAWRVADTFPIRKGKFVISGRLLAQKSARTTGTVKFQRRKGKKWVTVVSRVTVSRSMTFTIRVSRKANANKRVRFIYIPKSTSDYITSTDTFTISLSRKAVARSQRVGR